MAASKKQIVEQLAAVKNVGPSYAEKFYDELGVRSVDDLIEKAKKNELQKVSGVGAKREKTMLDSALAHRAEPVSKEEESGKLEGKKEKAAKKPEKKAAPKPEDKKSAKKPAKKEKPEPGKEDKTNGEKKRPKPEAWTSESSKKKSKPPSIPGLLFKLGKKLIGRLLR